jgi:hypothetical protein
VGWVSPIDGSGTAAQVEQAQALEHPALGVDVVVAEQLVAAADREHRHPGGDGALQRAALVLGEVGEDAALVAVLPAPHEEEVAGLEVGRAGLDGHHLDVDPPPLGAAAQAADVPGVAVDGHGVGIEVAESQRTAHRSRSQNALTAPARWATARSSSIAV